MKRFVTLAVLFVAVIAPLSAHGGFDHLRGVVTQISAQSITVQTSAKATKTLTVNAKTTFEKSGKPAAIVDLKVGDRVIVEVPEKTSEAAVIRFGATASASTAKK